MQRRKLIGAAAAGITAAALLAGCSSGDPAASTSSTSGPTVISFAASILGEPQRGPLITAMIDDFNKSQKNVTVTPTTIPFSSFDSTMFTQIGGGAGPDIVAWDEADFFQAMDQGLAQPIDGVVAEDKLLPSAKSYRMDGKRYGVPLNVSNYALIYNPDLVKNVPTTFDQLLAEAKAQTKDGVYGYAMRTTQAEETGVWSDVSNFVYGFGGRWSTSDGKPTVTSPKVIAGVKAMKEMYDANVIPKGATAADYRKMFAEGKVAMIVDNGGVPTVIYGTNPNASLAAAKAPFPTDSIGEISAVLAVNKNSDAAHADAARKFLKWFLEPAQQQTLQKALGGSQAATAVPRTEEELTKTPYVKVFDSVTGHALPFAPEGRLIGQTPNFRHAVVEQVLRILQGQVSVEAGMQQAQNEVSKLK